MRKASVADAFGIFAVEGEEPVLCSWCGKPVATGLHVDDCYCGMCKDCKFIHDGGPCRSGVVLMHARWSKDGFVHSIQWMNGGGFIVIPTCFDHHPHSEHWPQGLGFTQVSDPVDCLRCMAGT